MSSLTRRHRIPHEEPKEETPYVNVRLSAERGETRIPAPAVGTVQEVTPEASTNIPGFGERSTREEEIEGSTGVIVPIFGTMGHDNVVKDVVEWVTRTSGGVSRGKPRLHSSLKALLYAVFVSTVLWGLVKVTSPSLWSFHALLSFNEPLPPDLSPWTDLLSIENDMFEHLLKDMVVAYNMSMDVRDAEVKITDLRTLIRASGRPQKDLLVNDLSALLSEAKKSGKDLQTFATNIGQSLESIMGANDRAFQHIKRVTAREYRRVPLKSMEIRDFEEAMDVLHKSLEVMGTDVESNANGLRRIDEDIKAIMRSIRRSDEESTLARQPSKGDERLVKRFLHGLGDLESFAHQATYVISSAYNVIRNATQQLKAIRGQLDWELAAWSALNAKHINSIAVGLEKLEEKRIRAKSAQEELLTRNVD